MAFASAGNASGPNTNDANAARAATLQKTLQELNQTLALMSAPDPLEFYDISQRNKKYSSVNPQNGAELLEKVERGREGPAPPQNALATAIATAQSRNSGEYAATSPGERSATPTSANMGSMEARFKAGFGSMRGLSKRLMQDGSNGGNT